MAEKKKWWPPKWLRSKTDVRREELEKALAEAQKQGLGGPARCTTAIRNLAEFMARQGNADEAVAYYRRLVKQYRSEGFYVKAIAQLHNILNTDPRLLDVYEELADLYELQGLTFEARNVLKQWAGILEKDGRETKQLLDVLGRIAKLFPHDYLIRKRLGELHSQISDHEQAAMHYLIAAEILYSRGERDEFLKVANSYLTLKHYNASIRAKVADTLIHQGEFIQALDHLKIGHKADPKDENILVALEMLVGAFGRMMMYQKQLLVCQMLRDSYKELGREDKYAEMYQKVDRLLAQVGES